MQDVLLAPVPAIILASIKDMADASHVAFGTENSLADIPLAIPVYIFASATGVAPGLQAGTICWRGVLKQITPAEKSGKRSGKHPNKDLRPPYAEDHDGPSQFFWEVVDLQQLKKPVPLSKFRTTSGKKLSAIPHSPLLVGLEDGF